MQQRARVGEGRRAAGPYTFSHGHAAQLPVARLCRSIRRKGMSLVVCYRGLRAESGYGSRPAE